MLTAPEIREIATLEIPAGDLRRVPCALATVGARTAAARTAVRAALAAHCVPDRVYTPIGYVTLAEHRRQIRASEGLISSSTVRESYSPSRERGGDDPLIAPPSVRLADRQIRARELADARVVARVTPALTIAYQTCGYRRAESKWVGGVHNFEIRALRTPGRPDAAGASERVWHKKHPWSGITSTHTITVPRDWCERVPESARVVDRLLTLDFGVDVEVGIHPAMWVEQGRGVSIHARAGYLVQIPSGWVHVESVRGARALLSGPRPVRAVRTRAEILRGLDAVGLLRRARLRGDESVTRSIARAAGHCDAGIRDWCARHGLMDRESVTSRELAAVIASTDDRRELAYLVLARSRSV